MDWSDKINPVLATTADNDAVQTIENFQSSSNQVGIDTPEPPTTSAKSKNSSSSTNQSNFKSEKLDDESQTANNTASSLDCPICLQPCIHPARLPCGHVFCFLCIKGVACKSQRCAMCRQEIPAEFLDRPDLVNTNDEISSPKCTEDGYQWFYEGRNGWWQYDVRTSQDIEDAYKKREKSCTILVAGYVYTVDLEAMVQQRQNEPMRCRRVKRDLANVPKKGVAGLRLEDTIRLSTDSTGSNATSSSSYGNDLSSSEDSRISPAQNVNLEDFIPSRHEDEVVIDQTIEVTTLGSNDIQEISNSFEQQQQQQTELNRFPNTIQNNTYESEHRTGDYFQETLANLRNFTLRSSSDISNPTQSASDAEYENRYRNNHC